MLKAQLSVHRLTKLRAEWGAGGTPAFLFANRETAYSHEICGKTFQVIQWLKLHTTNSRGK